MKNKFLVSLLIASGLVCSGCSNNSSLAIEFDDIVPVAYVGEQYDFSDVLIVESGVDYNLEVYYQNYNTMEEKTLTVENTFCFTPVEQFDIAVIVNATKGNQKGRRTKIVQVAQKGDPIDELIITGAYSGYADQGFRKELVSESMYLKGENSRSAILANFQGANTYIWGASLFALNNFRLLEHWTDKEWTNSVLKFWVYNPTEKNAEFQLRIKDYYTGLVDVDWGSGMNIPAIAKPGEWTFVAFSLLHYGINHTLYTNEEGTRKDELNVKVKWAGAGDGSELYNYQLYFDDIDIVPYSREEFPDIDIKNYTTAETLEYGWENMARDEGWSKSTILFDREFVKTSEERESLSSMMLKFNEKDPDGNGYSVILNPGEEFLTKGLELPSLRHGLLNMDIHFSSNISDYQVLIVAVQNEPEWSHIARYTVNAIASSDDWMHVTFDFGEHEEFDAITECLRLGFGFPGVNDSNKESAIIHIDNIIFEQNGGVPERP